jgi:spermidine synthase
MFSIPPPDHPTAQTEDDLAMATAFRFERVHSQQSSKQLIEVFSSPTHGRLLFLNRSLQLSTRESAHYHETLVHVPMAYLMSAHMHSKPSHRASRMGQSRQQTRPRSRTQSQPRQQPPRVKRTQQRTYQQRQSQPHRHDNASPLRALIVGGGDGGSLTEVLRYARIGHVVQVEWDQVCVRFFRSFRCHISRATGNYPYLLLSLSQYCLYIF